MKTCSATDCNKKHYAKGFCRNHYNKLWLKGYTENEREHFGTCRYCTALAKVGDLCAYHKTLVDKHGPLKTFKGSVVRGNKNPNWNGGTSEYKNHYEFKKNRLVVIKNNNGKCVRCGEAAQIVHHIDGSKNNHVIDNLEPLCKKCHFAHHKGHKKTTSKYIRLYGYTLVKLAKIFHTHPSRIIFLHEKDLLSERLLLLK